jgi:YD repeat-containing protein
MEPSRREAEREQAYRVRNIGGGWEVFDNGGRSVSERMRSQADAVAHSKELARRDGSAQILVYDEQGKLASEFFYQREERTALAYDDDTPTMAATHPTSVGAVTRDPRGNGP